MLTFAGNSGFLLHRMVTLRPHLMRSSAAVALSTDVNSGIPFHTLINYAGSLLNTNFGNSSTSQA